ncbi:MAG TPA: ABC transporter ATP-binding protein [Candidatus Saccharimonadales bacterium]|nr:ABC transporter ATP-binding protein [Candidatus Saccharimonadales bacterium]
MSTLEVKGNTAKQVLQYYWTRVRAYPQRMLGILIAVPITILINGYLPALILASVLGKLSQHQFQSGHLWADFGPQLVLYGAMLLTGMLLWRLVDWFSWRLEQDVQRDIAEHVFRHMLQRSADFHANNFSGSLVSHTSKLLSSYVRLSDTFVYQTYPMVGGIIIATIILSLRAPLFATALIVFSAIYLTIALLVSRPVRRLGATFAAAESQQTGYLADAITNAMAVKSFAQSRHEEARFAIATTETQHRLRDFALAHKKQMNSLGLMSRLISASALLIAVIAVMKFNANIATVFLIFNYTANITEQLFQFGNNALRNYNRSVGDASDMVLTLAEKPEVQDPAEPETSRMGHGAIEFKDVTFTHNGADDAVFKGLSLSIKPGEKIGLVGHSGSGKSTFTRLLLRFSDIDSGAVLIDGQNIAHVTQNDLHRQIAYVPQEPLLFHRTIRENIAYGRLEATQEEIETAARMASAHDFILALPQGYDTLVGERGVKLSGGQRQRVAIARAMLKNAPILALDEATSALDSESEVLIQAALWKLMEGRTTIVIAHRLSTIQKMDRIIVLDNGRIVEQGSHKQLIAKKNGTYAKLWAHQSGGFIDD